MSTVLSLGSTLLAFAVLTAANSTAIPRSPLSFTVDASRNSKHFADYAQQNGATVCVIDFSSEAVGPLARDAYADLGITLKGTNGLDHITSSRGPSQGGETEPRSTGEGLHAATAYLGDSLGMNRAATLTVSFAQPVIAAGVDTIDLDSSSAEENARVAIYSGPNGTGDLLGSSFSKSLNFQQNNTYFMGLASDKANIRSLVFTSFGKANDRVGIAVVRYARLPLSSAWLWITGAVVLAILMVGALQVRKRVLRRRNVNHPNVRLPVSSRLASKAYRAAHTTEEYQRAGEPRTRNQRSRF